MGYILLIENNRELQEDIHLILALEGYESHCVNGSNEAIRAVETKLPNLIILDLDMRIPDGFAFLEDYCGRFTSLTPIMVLAPVKSLAPNISTCVTELLEKPFEILTLLESVKRHMALPDGNRILQRNGDLAWNIG